jgi:hypothetical protein
LTLPVGTHTATIQFVGSDGKPVEKLTKTVTFTLPATGPDQVIFISDTSTTPQAQ